MDPSYIVIVGAIRDGVGHIGYLKEVMHHNVPLTFSLLVHS